MGGYKTFGTEVLTSTDVNSLLMQQAMIRVNGGSRPTAQNGTNIWETDNLRDYTYNGSTWDALGFPMTRFAYKTADESVTSSTSLQNDDELAVSLTSSKWLVDIYLLITASAGTHMRWDLSGTTSMVSSFYTSDELGSVVDNAIVVNTNLQTAGGGNLSIQGGSDIVAFLRGILVTMSGTGTVTFRWAQTFSNGSPLTVRAKSFMFARRVA